MAGLEPARTFYGPTDFKSVASAIPPHRHFRQLNSTWIIMKRNVFVALTRISEAAA